MSLDVYLSAPEEEVACVCAGCGHQHTTKTRESLYSSNITHNLNRMAGAAGIYEHLWRPDEIGITKAAQLIEPLTAGLAKLEANPAEYEKYNATNGWGLYKHFVLWVQEYLAACIANPDADVSVSR